jgi:hypothetical protein
MVTPVTDLAVLPRDVQAADPSRHYQPLELTRASKIMWLTSLRKASSRTSAEHLYSINPLCARRRVQAVGKRHGFGMVEAAPIETVFVDVGITLWPNTWPLTPAIREDRARALDLALGVTGAGVAVLAAIMETIGERATRRQLQARSCRPRAAPRRSRPNASPRQQR